MAAIAVLTVLLASQAPTHADGYGSLEETDHSRAGLPGSAPGGEVLPQRHPLDDPDAVEWQEVFLSAVDAVRVRFPDDLAEPLVEEGMRSGSVGFRSLAPSGAREILAAVPDVTIVEGLGYSEGDILAAAERLHNQAAALVGDEIESSSSAYNALGRYFEVSYVSVASHQPNDHEIAQLTQRLTAEVMPPAGLPIRVNADEDSELVPQDLRGGHVTYKGGRLKCTASFPVKRNGSSEIGVLTAGHCMGSNTQWVPNAGMYFSVVPGSQSTSDVYPGGDFRWLWSNTMFDGFTWTGVDHRKFTGAGFAAGGAGVCKYGATTGYGCGTVAELGVGTTSTVQNEDGGGTYNVFPLTCTSTSITSGGDSGGPWYSGRVAYGIHTAGNASKSCYSQVNLALARFGLSLWTG